MNLRRFLSDPTKSGVDIVESPMLNAYFFRFSICLRNIELATICLQLCTKNGANFVFFPGPICFRGHFAEIGIAEVLLETKLCRVKKVKPGI